MAIKKVKASSDANSIASGAVIFMGVAF